jgi:hypothetical protein
MTIQIGTTYELTAITAVLAFTISTRVMVNHGEPKPFCGSTTKVNDLTISTNFSEENT